MLTLTLLLKKVDISSQNLITVNCKKQIYTTALKNNYPYAARCEYTISE